MSDGTINFIERTTDPDTPTTGRVKIYNKSGEPYYMNDTGTPTALKGLDGSQGPQGIQGIQGIQGTQGNVGPQGADGPVSLAENYTFVGLVTLPDNILSTFIMGTSFNVPSIGNYVFTSQISYRGHSNSSDMRFEWRLDGVTHDSEMVEETKDSNSAAQNPRGMQGNLGTLAAGSHDMDLYFSKEALGGNAQLKYLSLFVWRVS